jgi:hypothetical protein
MLSRPMDGFKVMGKDSRGRVLEPKWREGQSSCATGRRSQFQGFGWVGKKPSPSKPIGSFDLHQEETGQKPMWREVGLAVTPSLTLAENFLARGKSSRSAAP